MHDLMLANSPKLDRESLISYGKELNLDIPRFTKDLDLMRHKDLIERDKKLAVDMDLYNTPTFFINGRKVMGNRSYEYLQKIIDEELEHGGQ